MIVSIGAPDIHSEDKWEIATKSNHRRLFPNVHALPTGKVLICGGGYADSEVFDPVSRTTRTIAMKHVRASNGSVQFPDGRVAVFGGAGTHGPTPIEVFDPATETWTVRGIFPDGRYQNAAILFDSHRVLIIGGRFGISEVTATCFIYDIITGEVKRIADFPYVTSYTRTVRTADGRVLVFAGRSNGPLSFRTEVIHEYNISRGTWDEYGRMPQPNYYPSLCVLPSGQILIVGGSDVEGSWSDSFRKSVEIIDGTSVTSIMEMLETRAGHVVFGMSDTVCLVVGGSDDFKGRRTTCEWLNLMSRQSTFGPELNVARSFFGGAIVRGRDMTMYYVVAGGEPEQSEGSIEVLESKYCKEPPINLLEPKSFRLAGMAAVTEDGVRLTPSTGTAVGRMSSVIPLGKPSFEMSVGVRLSRGTDNGFLDGGPQGADGIAVIFSTGIDRTYLGRIGEGIGYDGLPNVVAVEVDAYRNPGMYDRDAQHVAVMVPVQGVTSSRHDEKTTVVMKPLPFDLIADGSVYDFNVSYNGSTLNVFASSANSGTRLVVSATSFDIYERLGVSRSTPIYASITAATGKSMQEHTIVRWNLEGCGSITSVEDDDIMPVMPFDSSAHSLVYDAVSKEIVVVSGASSDITVFDLTGQIVLRRASTHAKQRIDVSILPRGFYVVSSGTTSMSFIVHD